MGIKSNYFRHSFNAHQDAKIRKLIDKKGIGGYGLYFMLIELYCMKLYDDDERKELQEFDLKLIGSLAGVRSDSARSSVEVMSELKLIDQLQSNSESTMIQLSIPKALKYFGRYEKVREENCPNKRKEKEIKVKESKVNIQVTPDEVIQLYNETMQGKLKPFTAFLAGTALNNFLEARQYLKTLQDWKHLFEKVLQSDFLLGRTDQKWVVNFIWLVNYDNALKVISGNFDNEQVDYSYLFAGIKEDANA